MKFYDLDALENKCGTDNKYEITALVAARARWLSEHKTVEADLSINVKYLSMARLEFGKGEVPEEWTKRIPEPSGVE